MLLCRLFTDRDGRPPAASSPWRCSGTFHTPCKIFVCFPVIFILIFFEQVRLAQEKKLIYCQFVSQPGGTGEMVSNLSNGVLDVAIALTEGLVLASERGDLKNTKIVSVFVESPLQWGIHVNGKSKFNKVDDIAPKTCRIAISRQLSGSHLMSWVFAKEHKWPAADLKFVVVGGLTGALKAFEEDRVDLFLWDRFMTTPVVSDGLLKLIGVIPSPWPCFCVAANESVLAARGKEINDIIRIVLKEGRKLKRDAENVVHMLETSHKLSEPVAREWLSATVYAKPHPLPESIIKQILDNIPK
jgi:sulfonate transport system substrate-binding protein